MDNPAPARVSTEDVPDERANFESMIRGGMYIAVDPYVQKIARQEGAKVRAINAETDDEKRMELLRQFMGIGKEIEFIWTGPFFAEYVSKTLSLYDAGRISECLTTTATGLQSKGEAISEGTSQHVPSSKATND